MRLIRTLGMIDREFFIQVSLLPLYVSILSLCVLLLIILFLIAFVVDNIWPKHRWIVYEQGE
jgi:hypothetical protein